MGKDLKYIKFIKQNLKKDVKFKYIKKNKNNKVKKRLIEGVNNQKLLGIYQLDEKKNSLKLKIEN